jgi:acetylornithine/N-succinyldiaminopimelate aminotransferase
MVGIGLPPGCSAQDAVRALHGRGLLAIPAGERVVRLLPPLNVSPAEIDEAAKILGDTFRFDMTASGV